MSFRPIHLDAQDVARYVQPSQFFSLSFFDQRQIAIQILSQRHDPRVVLLLRNNPNTTQFVIDTTQ